MPVGEVYFRPFRTRQLYANMRSFQRSCDEGMREVVFPKIVAGLESKVAHWKDRDQYLQFKALQTISENGISLRVIPFGPGLRLWKFRSWGTKGYTMRVKKLHTMRHWSFKRYKPALAIPHRGVKRGFGPVPFAPGTVDFRYEVTIPEVPGQFYEKQVVDEYRRNRQLSNDMEKIVRKAVRVAQKEGT